MGYTVFYGGQNLKDDRAAWDSCGTDYIVRTNVEKTSSGFRRRRRYWCASPTSGNIGWKGDGTGGQACSGIGSVTALGGGQNGFSGKDQHFPGKFAGYKCAVSSEAARGPCVKMGTREARIGTMTVKVPSCVQYGPSIGMGTKLKTWSGDSKMTTAGANDNNRKFKSLYDQIVFGIETQYDTSAGFCADAKNLSTVVHKDGRTCYQMLKGAGQQALADTKTATYCATAEGRKDEKCKCFNVAGSTFIRDCRANPTWAGCKEIMPRINELQELLKGSNLKEADFGNADCIVPGICSGDVYQPLSGVPSCAKKMEVCNQVMNQDNVKAYGDLKAIQSCNFTGANSLENVQKRRDAEKAAAAKAALDAKKAADAKAALDAKKKADAKKKPKKPKAKKPKAKKAPKKKAPAPAPASKKAPAASPAPSGSPAVGGGLAKPGGMPQNTKIAIGVGGVVVLCCCLLLMMMMMGGGGGGGRRRR
jgi:hypothetical protein